MWKDAWTPRVTVVDEECVGESLKTKRKEGGRGGKKKQKSEAEDEVGWGEWLCRQILRGVADTAIELSDYMTGVEQWEEWDEDIIEEQSSTSCEKKERRLWRMLEESDKEQQGAGEENQKGSQEGQPGKKQKGGRKLPARNNGQYRRVQAKE